MLTCFASHSITSGIGPWFTRPSALLPVALTDAVNGPAASTLMESKRSCASYRQSALQGSKT
jgi:hypothetical protein